VTKYLRYNLKGERFNLPNGFRGFHPLHTDSIAVRKKGMEEENCSPYSSQEAERERKGQGKDILFKDMPLSDLLQPSPTS
jgi:hypothetical protein